MPFTNAEVADALLEIADLLEIDEANPFRIRAYRTAARTVTDLSSSAAELAGTHPEQLTDLPGIGEDLAGKIADLAGTGRTPLLDELRRRSPKGIRDLMRVPGIGPRKALRLNKELHVRSLHDLERAARTGKLQALPGFGTKTEAAILRELGALQQSGRRVLRSVAAQHAEPLVAHLKSEPGVLAVEVAGSYRRRTETVGDLDILVTCKRGTPAVGRFLRYPGVKTVLSRGPTKASVRLRAGLQVDLRVLPEASFGSGLYYFTGSKAHNIAIRRMGQERGLKINEYGVFRGRRRVAGASETEVLEAVGLPWIPPELRENRGEIAAAEAGHLPHLVDLDDIRGDLQCHTTDSDGRDSLEAMAKAAEALGYEYLAVTDHTPAVRVAGGLDRAGFRAQRHKIDRLNGRLKKLTVLAGAEVDIRTDGTLDLDDETLHGLDLVVVSLHSKLNLTEAEQTRRVCRALSHPDVDVLGHPAARLIGRRQPVQYDWEAVFTAARDHAVMLEVNGQPERLDLDDVRLRAAIGHGIRLTLGTDAHQVSELAFMRWGVDQARRGWAEPGDIANTLPLAKLRKLLHRER